MAAWKKWLNSQPFDVVAGMPEPQPLPLDEVRAQVLATLAGCQGPMIERMRWRLDAARTAQDLWMARGEIFQLVAAQHCQSEAVSRINALLPAFEGWLPARMLTRV